MRIRASEDEPWTFPDLLQLIKGVEESWLDQPEMPASD
jgi:hypothetical protein